MLPKAYSAADVEDSIYKMWEESGAFIADAKSTKEAFSISMPPPNATGQLHLGHAVMLALEDIFIRFARMQGKEVLWVPGTDHAAIATESLVIKNLQKSGMKDPRKHLGREGLIKEIMTFIEGSQGTIRSQVRKMGSSCDWSRERYTMEPALNRCVNEVFKLMYDDGLIYRGHRIVNWDPKLQTTVSDDEVNYVEQKGEFYTFQYGPFQIGTARPETKFGDKYVVMHPDDERYAQYKHGETFEAEWINGPVRATVIKDAVVDPAFGTGVMTITPWHDTIDFDIAERHGLEKEQIIDEHGKLLPIAGEFKGMGIEDARPEIVKKLKKKGLLVKVEEGYVHNKAVNSRGGGAIEPQIKLQWFIDVNREVIPWEVGKAEGQKGSTSQLMSLKQILHSVVHHGLIDIVPAQFQKTYFHWIDNLRDWCISRQIWWGHRVPVFYCDTCGDAKHVSEKNPKSQVPNPKVIVSVESIDRCSDCGGTVEQDPDTLDTWFSSALWTWSTLLDSTLAEDTSVPFAEVFKKSPDFHKFHPTSVMETGYDILFFWVARMILMTTYTLSKLGDSGAKAAELVPFKTVYLHGLIRTRDGRKMSKSDPDTMIDPLDIIQKYGADALRLSMIVGQSPGADSRLYEEKIAGYRNFINKLWNASRFVLLECEKAGIDPKSIEKLPSAKDLSLADRALLHALESLIHDVTVGLTDYRLSEVGERLYSFVWEYFCDWYLELSKGPSTGSGQGGANHAVLVHTLRRIMKLLHPYCPFVTESIWSYIMPEKANMLIKEEWPSMKAERQDQEAFDQLQTVIEVITAIRKLRTDHNVPLDAELIVTLVGEQKLLEAQADHIKRMARVTNLVFEKHAPKGDIASAFLNGVEVHLSLEGLIDKEKEMERLKKEQAELEKYAMGIKAKLENTKFVENAPKELVHEQKEKLKEVEEKLKKIHNRISTL